MPGSLINTTTMLYYMLLLSLIYDLFETFTLLMVKLLLLFISLLATNPFSHTTVSLVVPSSPRNGLPLLSLGIFPLTKHFLYDTVSLHCQAPSSTIPLLQTRTGHISKRNWHHRELFFCSHTWRWVFSSPIIPEYNYSTSRVLFFGSFLGWCHFSPSHWQ